MKSSSQIEDEADEADPPHPRGPPLRTPSGGGLPRPGTGTSTTYARAKHAQLTLKDLAQARDLMVQEIESRGESAQSALKDLVCILKQMGSHAEATATIVRYRAAWPDDDRMQESLDNMLLDLFKHARNLEGEYFIYSLTVCPYELCVLQVRLRSPVSSSITARRRWRRAGLGG